MAKNKLQDQYFGNYRGEVMSHGTKGYCKIFVPGVYPESYRSNIANLPWAEPCQPLFAGGAIGNGVFEYPDITAKVWLFFESGNINYPKFFALTNNDKNKFISGEFLIKYNNAYIKFDSSNNITITGEGGTISINATTISINGITNIIGPTNVIGPTNIIGNTKITGDTLTTGNTTLLGNTIIAGVTNVNGNINTVGPWSIDMV